jgi:hypothetical protein
MVIKNANFELILLGAALLISALASVFATLAFVGTRRAVSRKGMLRDEPGDFRCDEHPLYLTCS